MAENNAAWLTDSRFLSGLPTGYSRLRTYVPGVARRSFPSVVVPRKIGTPPSIGPRTLPNVMPSAALGHVPSTPVGSGKAP